MKKIILALLLSTSLAHKTIEDLSEVESVEVQDDSGTIVTDQEEGLKEDSFDLKVPSEERKMQTFKERVIEFMSHDPKWFWKHFKEEIGYLSIIIVIAINFYIGKG